MEKILQHILDNIGLYILALWWIVQPVIRLFSPTWMISGGLLAHLDNRGTTRKYLLTLSINQFAFGLLLIALAIFPDQLLLFVCIFAIILISVLVCNKRFIGSFWRYFPSGRKHH